MDNSATTKVFEETAQKAVSFMVENYGNPSSLHTMGFKAKCALDEAREIISKSISAKPEEIYFTSGGTESNNLAIFGAAEAGKRNGRRIVTTEIEHPSVLAAMKDLERQGYEVEYLKPDSAGKITDDKLDAAIDDKTILVSLMMVNNETGTVLPTAQAGRIIRRKKSPALLHVDAVQGYMKLPLSPKKAGADLISISGHKVHAPKGVGALYVSKNCRIKPQQFGGGQENGLRSGTQAMPLIAAFGNAVEIMPPLSETQEKVRSLNETLRAGLLEFPEVKLHSQADGIANIVNFSAGKVRAETMLHFLAQKGVYVSSGSACGRLKPSHVLTAMGIPKEEISSSLRVSFSHLNEMEDISALLSALREGLDSLCS